MDRLKVIVSLLSDAALSDGCVGHTAALVRAFELHGCDIDLVALSGNGENRVGGNALRLFAPTPFGTVAAAFAAVAAARVRRADLLVCTSLGAPFNPIIALGARLLRIPVLYDCQDPPIESMALLFGHSLSGKILRGAVALLDPVLRSAVRWTLVVSPGVEKIMRLHGWRMPILKFFNSHGITGVNPQGGVYGYRSEYEWQSARVLIYAGGLQPGIRGIETQLQAVALAREAGANVKFIAFGRGNTHAFQQMARDLGIAEHVKFPGEVSQERLHAALREADVAVMSTLPFALPSKIFEYLACGLTVICNADNRDIIEAFGELVQSFDGTPGSLALALVRCSLHAQKREMSEFLSKYQKENDASVRAVCAWLRETVTSRKMKTAAPDSSRAS